MQEIFSFLKEYWQLIVAVLAFVASLIVSIVRKRPIDNIFSAICVSAIQAVKIAENNGGKGIEKLGYAIGLVEADLAHNYPNINLSSYYNLIENVIEKILSTPQKKGGN